MNKNSFFLLTLTALLGCKSPENQPYSIEDIELSEQRAELSSSPERIRLYEDMIQTKQIQLSAILTAVTSYGFGSEEYTQLYSQADEISAQIKSLEERIEEEKTRQARLRENR